MNDFENLFAKLFAVVIMTIAVCVATVNVIGYVVNYHIIKQAMENGYVEEIISKDPLKMRWVKEKDIPTLEI